jgi:hypothetical protein
MSIYVKTDRTGKEKGCIISPLRRTCLFVGPSGRAI